MKYLIVFIANIYLRVHYLWIYAKCYSITKDRPSVVDNKDWLKRGKCAGHIRRNMGGIGFSYCANIPCCNCPFYQKKEGKIKYD